MKLENLASISEIFSSIAIVITLIVLVFEVQGNTAALQRQIENDRASRLSTKDSPYIPNILTKIREVHGVGMVEEAYVEKYDLSYEEASRIRDYYAEIWRGYEADFISDQPGAEGRNAQMSRLMSSPGHVLFWELTQNNFYPEFVDHVNSLM